MNSKNEVFEYLINQLRQQVSNNPYKQQCEDLAHDVQSLKNQLRDASALVAELHETIKLMNEDFNRATGRGGSLPKGESYVVGEHGPEQSGCRKILRNASTLGLLCLGCFSAKAIRTTFLVVSFALNVVNVSGTTRNINRKTIHRSASMNGNIITPTVGVVPNAG